MWGGGILSSQIGCIPLERALKKIIFHKTHKKKRKDKCIFVLESFPKEQNKLE